MIGFAKSDVAIWNNAIRQTALSIIWRKKHFDVYINFWPVHMMQKVRKQHTSIKKE